MLLELLFALLLEDLTEELEAGLDEELEVGLDELLEEATLTHLAQNSLSPLSVFEIFSTASPSYLSLSYQPSNL